MAEDIGVDSTTNGDPEWEAMTRAWFLINVDGAVNKAELAQKIYNELNEEYQDNDKIFVIRVDVVSGGFDLVAPVYTDDDYENHPDELTKLDEIEAYIENLPEVTGLTRTVVVTHVPDPSWDTEGFITYQEARNPARGKRSHRPW
jgi:hypothetical protein